MFDLCCLMLVFLGVLTVFHHVLKVAEKPDVPS